jgi:hypothetical protein
MEKKLNFKQKLFVILLDFIVLAELAASLYWTNQFGESMTPMFLKTYLPVVFLTLIIGKFCLNKLESKDENMVQTDMAVSNH